MKHLSRLILGSAGAGLLVLAPVAGATAEEGARYTMEKTAEGYVRMDTKTGEMSLCQEQNGQLVCRTAADERTAFQDELETLAARIQKLEDRVAALEAAPAPKADGLPSDEEFEKGMGLMERFMRRFMGIVKDLDREFGSGSDEKPSNPERTDAVKPVL